MIIPGAGKSIFRLTPVATQAVTVIPLAEPLDVRQAELSGLAWHGDTLVLLPQFPEEFDQQLYGISKSALVAYLTGQSTVALEPQPIGLDDGAVSADYRLGGL
ncbi:MAG: hypothetical protein R2932_04310 [Caldilineaceae bacterium]